MGSEYEEGGMIVTPVDDGQLNYDCLFAEHNILGRRLNNNVRLVSASTVGRRLNDEQISLQGGRNSSSALREQAN